MERKPISGILIINNIKSVEEILLIIQKYTRVFTANPIRILCCDAEKDAAEIRKYQQKYGIQMAPALISKDGSITIGKAKICAFLPEFAHSIDSPQPQQPPRAQTPPEDNPYQQSSDFADEEDEAANEEKMAQKMARYREEMKKRGASILQCDSAPVASARPTAQDDDDDMMPATPTPPPKVSQPPRAPTVASRKGKGEDAFLSMFDNMMDEIQTS